METFSHRESVLLGYSPKNSFVNHTNSSPKSPSDDIDFNDVFGGPPRRASMQEARNSSAEITDTYSLRRSDNDETNSYARHRWSGLGEKPVFGEEGANRRRYPSHDFFDDIFKGNESFSSSPRKNDRDPVSSSPRSRVLSPLPPKAEPFSSSSVPARFSLPAKLNKATDLSTFGSSGRNYHKNKDGASNDMNIYSYSPLSRFSGQANQVQEEGSRNDVGFKRSFSQEPLLINEGKLNLAKPDEMDKSLGKDLNGSTGQSNQLFHFSIYKWASKGVPLVLPLRGGNGSKLKEKIKFERSVSSSGRIACEGMAKELSSVTPEDINSLSINATKSSEIKLDRKEKENGSLFNTNNRRVEQAHAHNVEDAVLIKSKSLKRSPTQSQKLEKKTQSVLEKGLFEKTEEQLPRTIQGTPKNELKMLRSLISGADEITANDVLKENNVKSTKKPTAVMDVSGVVKKQDGKETVFNNEEMGKSNLQGSPTSSRDNSIAKNRGRGKVKEFVKIFSQEASNKPNINDDSQFGSSRWKERGKFKPQDDAAIMANENEKVWLPDVNKDNMPNASIKPDDIKQSDERQSKIRNGTRKSTDISSGFKDGSTSNEASIPHDSEAMLGDLGDSFQGNILIKELPEGGDEQAEAGDSQEEIKVIDAKIRKWSNGKEGNIRSMLSTLQYVLWPGSGWKPVPLVDIIEGNAVKRSYQKALLSLHPDKLQQKGATFRQKYTAEKVFDILQEAWSHFNAVGSL